MAVVINDFYATAEACKGAEQAQLVSLSIGPSCKYFPPTPCFAHRVDAKPLSERTEPVDRVIRYAAANFAMESVLYCTSILCPTV